MVHGTRMRRLWLAFIFVCTAGSLAMAANDIYLTDAIKNPAYLRALTNLLINARNLPIWTQQIAKTRGNYVGAPVAYTTIDGRKYQLFHTCKPHACDNSQLEVMFSSDGAQAWGAFMEKGNPVFYLGAPNPAQRSAFRSALLHRQGAIRRNRAVRILLRNCAQAYLFA